MILFMSEKRFREIVRQECQAITAKGFARTHEVIANGFAWMRDRQHKQEALLSELLDAVTAQNAAIETLKTNLVTEVEQINAKLDELSGGGDIVEAVAAIRNNTDRINEAANAISAIIPDAPPEP